MHSLKPWQGRYLLISLMLCIHVWWKGSNSQPAVQKTACVDSKRSLNLHACMDVAVHVVASPGVDRDGTGGSQIDIPQAQYHVCCFHQETAHMFCTACRNIQHSFMFCLSHARSHDRCPPPLFPDLSLKWLKGQGKLGPNSGSSQASLY